jgi:hypothetical protein
MAGLGIPRNESLPPTAELGNEPGELRSELDREKIGAYSQAKFRNAFHRTPFSLRPKVDIPEADKQRISTGHYHPYRSSTIIKPGKHHNLTPLSRSAFARANSELAKTNTYDAEFDFELKKFEYTEFQKMGYSPGFTEALRQNMEGDDGVGVCAHTLVSLFTPGSRATSNSFLG